MKKILLSKKLTFFYFTLSVIFSVKIVAQANYTVSRFDYTWCTNSYPTSYVTGSWSITELATAVGGHNGFSKNQSGVTLIIDLPAGFEFNTTTASATITEGGTPEPMTISWVYTSVTRLTLTIDVPNHNNNINSLDFNNFQIRCTASGSSGNMVRNGGTMDIDQATTNPTSSEPLGIFSSATPFSYTGSSVTQSSTSNVTQYSINQDILRIKISGTGTCGATVTQFVFNTDGGNGTGTNLTSNITNAKIYCTGSSSTFATSGYFGTIASPSGSFTITGSQDLTNTDTYFWLTYDVPGSANTAAGSNLLDAQLTNFVLNGTTYTNMTTPAPSGSRTIIGATFYYSRGTGNWNGTANLWSYTSGGASCSCQPNGTGVVVIDVGHTVTIDATRTVDVMQINNGATLTGGSALTVNSSLVTAGTGKFTLTNTLSVSGNVTLAGTGACTDTKKIDINGDLNVGSGTSMTASGGSAQGIYIGGNLTVDGTLTQSGGQDITLDVGAAFILAGSGTITTTGSVNMSAGSKSVSAGSSLVINADFTIAGAYTLTNNASIDLNGNLIGSNASAKWINKGGSTLNYGGTTKIFSTNGVLDASSVSNTVNFNGASQDVNQPNNSGQFNNLTLSGSGTKTLRGDILVSGDFVTNATLAANSAGVSFNGTAAQTISGTVTPTFFDLTINNSNASGVTLSEPVNASNSLSLTAGLLTTTSTNILTMQNGSTCPALTNASTSYVVGPMKYQKSASGSTVLNFPIGKGSDCRPVVLTVNHTDNTLYNYTGELFNANPFTTFGSNPATDMPSTVDTISGVHYWDIARTNSAGTSTPSTGLSGNQTIKLYFGTNDYVYQGSSLTIVKNTSATPATWYDIGGTSTLGNFSTPQAGSITSTSSPSTFTSFSAFSLGSRTTGWNSLPVELLSFTAVPDKGKVDLKWTTATELNNKDFVIERSADGTNFKELLTVPSKAPNGNSTKKLEYASVDASPLNGTSYYRLHQNDYNGQKKYFNVVSVTFGTDKYTTFTVYPNPNQGQFKADFTGLENNHEVQILMHDINGKLVYASSFYTAESQGSMDIIPTEKISRGTYFCSLIIEGIKQTVKVTVE